MTRRLTFTILFTVWAFLLLAGVASYWIAGEVLLSNLDETLRRRAALLPELTMATAVPATTSPRPPSAIVADSPESERYIIRTELDRRTLPRPMTEPGDPAKHAELVSASFSTLSDDRRVRAVTIRTTAASPNEGESAVPVLVTYSGDAGDFDRVMSQLAWTFTACGIAAGVAAAAIAHWLSRSTLTPLTYLADLIGTISEARLDRRVVSEELPAELAETGARLNEMLEKLQEAFARRRQFLADASHELRTPVAALVTGLEVALLRERKPETYRSTLTDALADVSSLSRLVERLMEHAKSERMEHQEPWEIVDIAPVLQQCSRVAATLGELRSITVDTELPAVLLVRTQPGRLQSIATNLLCNAVEYNREGGAVLLRAWEENGTLRLTVRDTGRGIAADQRTTIFEPFVRGDTARTGSSSHFGLGLYAVQTHVAALGGRCDVESTIDLGSEFQVSLPASPISVDAPRESNPAARPETPISSSA